jgi:hypothetical protein
MELFSGTPSGAPFGESTENAQPPLEVDKSRPSSYLAPMTWEIFKAVNKRIVTFRGGSKKVTLPNIIGWSGGAITFVTSFSGGFDWVAPRAISYLTGRPELVTAWPANQHWGSKALVSLLILGFFYSIVFAVQTTVLLSEQKPAAPPPDFRVLLAETIGVNFTRVRDYYEVTNDNGDCFIIHEAEFAVGDFYLSHLERKLISNSATWRGEPFMEVPLHPPEIDPKTSADTSGNLRVYHFRFHPSMYRTTTPCMIKFKEDMRRGIWMWREDVPFDAVLGGYLESISRRISEPTDRLELKVTFPRGYRIDGDRNFKVRLGTTENLHSREEQRLAQTSSVKTRIDDDKQILEMFVDQPIIGLSYFLCWVPPSRPGHKKEEHR